MNAVLDNENLAGGLPQRKSLRTPPSACSARPRATENAGHPAKAVALADAALALAGSEAFAEEIGNFVMNARRRSARPVNERFVESSAMARSILSSRMLRAEGELVTITTA